MRNKRGPSVTNADSLTIKINQINEIMHQLHIFLSIKFGNFYYMKKYFCFLNQNV